MTGISEMERSPAETTEDLAEEALAWVSAVQIVTKLIIEDEDLVASDRDAIIGALKVITQTQITLRNLLASGYDISGLVEV